MVHLVESQEHTHYHTDNKPIGFIDRRVETPDIVSLSMTDDSMKDTTGT